jgi:SAM-dependent methyltransferase
MKRKRSGQAFWDAEYKEAGHLALSLNPSEDLEKFTRWLEREEGHRILNITSSVLDLGCGNGRNILWLAETYGMRGVGYDISGEAVRQAERLAKQENLNLTFGARSIGEPIPLPDESATIALDMMTSHFLKAEERTKLIAEILRVLKPGGYFFYKTFLLDEDKHAKRMITENPADEENTYIHPKIGVAEHVSTEEEIEKLYGEFFTIHKISKSHRHKGKHAKRRSISVYMQKPEF